MTTIETTKTIEITLYTDAKAKTDRFAICNAEGEAVWYGKFFADDRDYNGEQSTGEMAAAKKAVWLAKKVADETGAKARLTLKTDAEWLTWANYCDPGSKQGGKARELAKAAAYYGVELEVEHVKGAANPADVWTTASGFKKYDLGLVTYKEVA